MRQPPPVKSQSAKARPAKANPKADDGERRYRAPALEKGLDILELLAVEGAPMTPSQISARLDRSMSELFRMILVLEYKGYILPAASGEGYELSNKLFTLGMARAPVKSLLESAMPLMRQLSQTVGQSCHLAVASDDQMVVIARIENPGQLGFSVRPGHRRSLARSPSGAVLFAFQSPEVQESWIDAITAAGEVSAKEIAAFRVRAEAVAKRGYERSASRYVEGITDISAPIMAGPACIAALTIPFVKGTPMPCGQDETIVHLRAVAEELSSGASATI